MPLSFASGTSAPSVAATMATAIDRTARCDATLDPPRTALTSVLDNAITRPARCVPRIKRDEIEIDGSVRLASTRRPDGRSLVSSVSQSAISKRIPPDKPPLRLPKGAATLSKPLHIGRIATNSGSLLVRDCGGWEILAGKRSMDFLSASSAAGSTPLTMRGPAIARKLFHARPAQSQQEGQSQFPADPAMSVRVAGQETPHEIGYINDGRHQGFDGMV